MHICTASKDKVLDDFTNDGSNAECGIAQKIAELQTGPTN